MLIIGPPVSGKGTQAVLLNAGRKELVRRLLARAQGAGRSDDNERVIGVLRRRGPQALPRPGGLGTEDVRMLGRAGHAAPDPAAGGAADARMGA
ncbi:hypothetical protein [Pseudarthrobacter sp. S9]|uniref:hypothetical protein n=1 Tax=Pseudarthrobacter sp. S9 TaxID=3418421 RepID=UPI003D08050D